MIEQNKDQQRQRVAIVTGGSSGIGKAIAEVLAQDSVKVVISDVNDEAGKAVAAEVGGHYVHADLCQAAACHQLVAEAVERYGQVDILVNNAGIQCVSPIEEFPEDKWTAMIQLMLTAPFILTKQVWPYMKQQRWGRIINMGSVHSLVASLNKSAYITAKHGLLGLTRASALEGGEYGITANSVCPAYVRTPLVENQIADQARHLNIDKSEVETQVMLKSAAIKRLINPEEVAELVRYLCSDKAGAVTGAAWNMDLGWTAQ